MHSCVLKGGVNSPTGVALSLKLLSELNLEAVQFNKVETYKLFTFTSGTFTDF